jgi:hypothetical protein
VHTEAKEEALIRVEKFIAAEPIMRIVKDPKVTAILTGEMDE